MRTSDLQQKIIRHQEALAALGRRVDQVLASVEALTLEAHEFLTEYQEKKRAAGKALGAAGSQFLRAQRAFRNADDLLVDLTAIKDVHVVLSQAVNNLLAKGNSAEARRVLRDLMKTRRALRATYRRIERCRGEARMAEISNDGDPDE